QYRSHSKRHVKESLNDQRKYIGRHCDPPDLCPELFDIFKKPAFCLIDETLKVVASCLSQVATGHGIFH
ncbi:MAG: hypothetical protein JXR76_11515, partial [Deltaproteobacteria bacterium]|nr:hypothetical protein [Deltaproteobacteria bacterium]